jgi:hypothetical protein
MPFLSLGLLDNEKRDAVLRDETPSAAGAQTSLPDSTQDAAAASHSLPPEIEQLRQKLSEQSAVKPVATTLAASVDALSSSERYGVPTFSTFKFGYLPARGLLYSTIFHELALFALFLLFTYGLPVLQSAKLIPPNTQDHLVYLPEVGGGTEGQKSPGAGQSAPQQPSAAPAHASKGFAYPGSQAILSDPPNPTNVFQTIQRPLLVHPEPIRKLVPLPNIVQMAETRLPRDLIAPKAAMPQHHPVPQAIKVKQDSTTHREAQWKVPVNDAPKLAAKLEMPKLPAAEQPLPDAPKIQPKKQEDEEKQVEKPSPKPIKVSTEKRAEKSDKQVAPPSPAQVARMEMHGKALEPLVSLSPMPLPPGSNAKVPNGEARGRFAIAPGGTLNPNSLTPGKSNGTPSTTPATGQAGSQSPNAATEVASNAGTGAGHSPVMGGGSGNARAASGSGSTGVGTGSGTTAGGGAGGSGTGKGRGAAGTGKGASGSSGRGAGTGSGGGSGSGTGSFPGITIQGGENNPSEAPIFTIAQQAPYSMTVVSTASSGGGLEDFGVFDKERVFTVYVPMKRTPDAEDPTWTLQYALLNDDSNSADADQQVVAPSAVMREWPEFPADLEQKYAQRQVVIYAVVEKDGKVGHISVKQTPDSRMSDPIVQALSKWVFRPAQLNGQPVAVKVLIGIPL